MPPPFGGDLFPTPQTLAIEKVFQKFLNNLLSLSLFDFVPWHQIYCFTDLLSEPSFSAKFVSTADAHSTQKAKTANR